MDIKGISNPISGMGNSGGTKGDVKALEQQKKLIQQEMETVKKDDSLDEQSKKAKMETLQKELKAIEEKIQNLKQGKGSDREEEVSENGSSMERMNPKDKYDKGNTNEQWDNTYQLTRDENGVKIKFNRPKKENSGAEFI